MTPLEERTKAEMELGAHMIGKAVTDVLTPAVTAPVAAVSAPEAVSPAPADAPAPPPPNEGAVAKIEAEIKAAEGVLENIMAEVKAKL